MSLFKSGEGERLASFAEFKGAPSDQLDVAAVQTVDASFDPDVFLAGAKALFADVRAALSAGTIDAVSGRLAPALTATLGNHLRFTMQSGHQLIMTSLDDVAPTLRGVEVLSTGELTCLVRYKVRGRMGMVALMSELPPPVQLAALETRTWYETWRMSRPAGVASPPLPQACPSCGAPASGESHCHYCSTLLVDATTEFRIQSIECLG